MSSTPFFVPEPERLREKLARAERDGTLAGRVWSSVRRRARTAPASYPWFTPLVALVTREESAVEAARRAIRNYVATFPRVQCSLGVQFHFWCFAFPHARWALYFQWLDSIGAWDPAEAERLRAELLTFQYVNFHYGLRTKPEPECVDNQTMSLAFSNALLGQLFGQGPAASALAARMRRDGLRRLPSMLGGMPPSGYSGEGSTYMDHVVGPSIPFIVELLEQADGSDWFGKTLPPHGGSAEAVVRMIAREWTPTGLTLPWDHYGYSLPVRSCIAYAAHRTRDPFYRELLERHANWSHDVSIGWGYDDLVWSLVWWPEEPAPTVPAYRSWAEPSVGGALVSNDGNLYLMQMWDRSEPGFPTRAHVNPNALVLCAFGSPLTTDGVPAKGCTALDYPDAWRARAGVTSFGTDRHSFGPGCAGAHGVLLVDGRDSLRAEGEYEQARLLGFDANAQDLAADVTPLYREHWPDTLAVQRRSQLAAAGFWLIEDLACFRNEHTVTARWYLRPRELPAERGVAIETAEGVRLRLFPLLGPDTKTVRLLAGYPDRLDGASLQVDFTQRGRDVRWLWLAWPEATRQTVLDLTADWEVRAEGGHTTWQLPCTMPPFMLADLPLASRWHYRRRFTVPAADPLWLRLPTGLVEPRLWVDGREVDLAPYRLVQELLPPQVALPPLRAGTTVELALQVDCAISQYGPNARGGSGFWGAPALLSPCPPAAVPQAAYRDGLVTVRRGATAVDLPYTLMEAPVC